MGIVSSGTTSLTPSRLYQLIMEEGEAALLRRQLERRFGPLPSWAIDRIRSADRATVEAWGERVLDAAGLSLDELLT